jgi:hypothetical protein
MDKFAAYYQGNEDRIREFSEYVHLNFKLIEVKMLSEMRRKLNIKPALDNSDGYVSLMASIHGRMFNEMVYSLSGMIHSLNMTLIDVIPPSTLLIILDLIEGKNYLKGDKRTDVNDDKEKFEKYYLEHIDALRANIKALPK